MKWRTTILFCASIWLVVSKWLKFVEKHTQKWKKALMWGEMWTEIMWQVAKLSMTNVCWCKQCGKWTRRRWKDKKQNKNDDSLSNETHREQKAWMIHIGILVVIAEHNCALMMVCVFGSEKKKRKTPVWELVESCWKLVWLAWLGNQVCKVWADLGISMNQCNWMESVDWW